METLHAPNEFFRIRRLREGVRQYGLESVRQRAWSGLDARTWTEAVRDGLANAALATTVRRCLAIAVGRVPAELRPVAADLADLVESGRCPGDSLAERADGAAEYTAGTFRQAC